MRDVDVRLVAQTLRHKGKSINDIASKLSVPKSTVSIWCRDIALSPAHIRALGNKMRKRSYAGSLKAAEVKRNKRIAHTQLCKQEGAQDVGVLSRRDVLILGMGLYWGEGYKYGNSELGFTNSDPNMIKMFLRWMREIYGIPSQDMILRVSINALYRSKAPAAITYWSAVTGTSKEQFTQTSFIRTKLRKFNRKNGREYHGTLRVKVRRGTHLHRRILGSLEHLARLV